MHQCQNRTIMCSSHRKFSVDKVKSSRLFPFQVNMLLKFGRHVCDYYCHQVEFADLIVKVVGGHVQSQTSNLRPNRSQSPFPDTPRETPIYVLLIAKISISPFIGSLSSLEDFQITHHKSHITIHKSQVSAQCKRLTYTRH
jgi:hypothetical protein